METEQKEKQEVIHRNHECREMAQQLGVSEKQMRDIGVERYKAMSNDARAYMLNLAHNSRNKRKPV